MFAVCRLQQYVYALVRNTECKHTFVLEKSLSNMIRHIGFLPAFTGVLKIVKQVCKPQYNGKMHSHIGIMHIYFIIYQSI